MIIPILHLERQVQLKDLTRFDASRSTLVKGSAGAITKVEIKPGANSSFIDVFNASSKNWYLDFAFTEYKFDVDSTNSKINFESNGSHVIDVPAGTYTLAALLTAIKVAIETEASPLTVAITVDDRNRINIAPDGDFKLVLYTSNDIFYHLGFKKYGQLTGSPIEYGIRKVTLKVSSSTENVSVDEYVRVYTVEGDALFSEDADLVAHENDIIKWIPAGRGSFIDLHRRAQRLILDWVDRQGYRDESGDKITKFSFVNNTDVRVWSTYLVLRLFFMGAQNAVDDVFKKKSEYYSKLEIEARDRAILSLDLDNDGKEDAESGPDIRSGRLFFR